LSSTTRFLSFHQTFFTYFRQAPYMESEQTIIRLAKSGDIRAFETLVQTYSHRLFATALRVLGDKDSAEECVQEDPSRVPWNLASATEPLVECGRS
jgi:hypothetical protein